MEALTKSADMNGWLAAGNLRLVAHDGFSLPSNALDFVVGGVPLVLEEAPELLTSNEESLPLVYPVEDDIDAVETARVMADHPDLLDRIAAFERDGSRGQPLDDVLRDLDTPKRGQPR